MLSPLPDLEVLGLRYLQRRASAVSFTEPADAAHILNESEQRALRRIERGVVLRAALAGALSALVAATVEVWVLSAGGPAGAATTAGTLTAVGWAWVIGATLLATAGEVAFLYWDALRSVHELAVAAGVRLFAPGTNQSSATAAALARAALELPNRPDALLGVNPHRDISSWALLAATLLYKAKIGLTNFVVKLAIRRLAGRATIRTWLPFVAVPITAAWNAWVAYTLIREARVRAMGPSAARERVTMLLDLRPELSPPARQAVLRAVAATVVHKKDMHPNLAALLQELHERLGACASDIDDRAAFLDALPRLTSAERDVVLALLSFALVLDGRLTRREVSLLRQAQTASGLPADATALRRLRRSGSAAAAEADPG